MTETSDSLWAGLKGRFFGYDFFVSYRWNSGGPYAVSLAECLRDRGFDCFLDRSEFAAGDDWFREARKALRNTQRLIVIATREAIRDSEAVRHEVEIFTERSDRVIPIVFGRRFSDAERQQLPTLRRIPDSTLNLIEAQEQLDKGPSIEVLERLIASHRVLRRRSLRACILLGLFTVVTFAITAALGYWGLAQFDRAERVSAESKAATEAARADEASRMRRVMRDIANVAQAGQAVTNNKTNRAIQLLNQVATEDQDWEWHRVRWLADQSVAVFSGHEHSVQSAVFLPLPRQSMSASFDGTIRFWDSRRANPIRTYDLTEDGIRACSVSPDGEYVAYGTTESDGKIFIMRSGNGEPVKTLQGIEDPSKILFSSDGGHLLVSDYDNGVVQSYETANWSPRTKFVHGQRPDLRDIRDMSLDPVANRLATATGDMTFHIWDLATGEQLHEHDEEVDGLYDSAIAFDRTGKYLATATPNDGFRIWQPDSGKFSFIDSGEKTERIAASPIEDLMAIGTDSGRISLWQKAESIASWHKIASFHGHENEINSLAFSTDGERLISGGDDGKVRIWDIDHSIINKRLVGGSMLGSNPRSASFSPDGTRVAVGGSNYAGIHNLKDGSYLKLDEIYDVYAVEFCPNGKRLAIGCLPGGLALYEASTGNLTHTLVKDDPINAVAFSRSGTELFSTTNKEGIAVWNVADGSPVTRLKGHDGKIHSLSTSRHTDLLVSAGSDGMVCLWDTSTYSLIKSVKAHSKEASKAVISPKGEIIVSSGHDDKIKVWSVPELEELATMPGMYNRALALSRSGHRIAIGGMYVGDSIMIWDYRNGALRHVLDVDGSVSDIQFSPTSDSLLVVKWDDDCDGVLFKAGLEN